MKKVSSKVGISCLLWLLILCFPIQGRAAKDQPGKQAAFTAEMIASDHQINPEKDYFDLRVAPDEELNLQFRLKNLSNQPVTVAVEPAFGITNDNGVIGYETNIGQKIPDMGIIFPEIVQVDSSVWLDAKEEKIVTAHVKMPTEAFDGVMLGAMSFREASPSTSNEQKQKKSVAIHTEYAYVIGVQLSETEEHLPESLELYYVKPDQIDGENVFTVALKHPVSQILNNVELQGKIYDAKDSSGKKPLYTAEQKGVRFAPNAEFQWQMALPDQQFQVGNYRLELEATSGKEHWKFQREFEVTKEDAKKFNQNSLFVAEKSSHRWSFWGWFFLGLCCLLSALGAIAYWRVPQVRRYMKQTSKQLRTQVSGLWKKSKRQPASKSRRRKKKVVSDQVVKKKTEKRKRRK